VRVGLGCYADAGATDLPELRSLRMTPHRALREEPLELESQSHEPAHSRNSP
jgi:hypothetical protein